MARRYALVIGIAQYDKLRNLDKAVSDANAIADLLEEHGRFEKVQRLPEGWDKAKQRYFVDNKKLTLETLNNALDQFLYETAKGEDALIYFAGHGLRVPSSNPRRIPPKGYLAVSNSAIDGQNALPIADFNELIQNAPLSSLVVLLDCCHAGSILEVPPLEPNLLQSNLSAFLNKTNYFLMTACRSGEIAYEEAEHGIFTGALLAGLSPQHADRQGKIDTTQLYSLVSAAVQGKGQEPFYMGLGGRLAIVEYPPSLLPDATERSETRLPQRSFGIPFQVPPLPTHFVARPEQQQAIKTKLLAENGHTPGTLVVSAIYGLGGIGKSVLAAAIAHDLDVQARFPDGILWATLGQEPDILSFLSGWIQAVGDRDFKPITVEMASTHLRTLLHEKQMLLVVDDAWNPDHVSPFQVGSSGCRLLVTTREADIPNAQRHNLDVMTPEESRDLLGKQCSRPLTLSEQQQAAELAQEVGHLPLALELAAAQIEDGITFAELLDDLRAEIARLETFDRPGAATSQTQQKRYSLLASLNLSVQRLSPGAAAAICLVWGAARRCVDHRASGSNPVAGESSASGHDPAGISIACPGAGRGIASRAAAHLSAA